MRLKFVIFRFTSAPVLHNYASATPIIISEMANTMDIESTNTIPRAWRILLYAVSILGFGNVAMCSWLPAKLRTASIVYHGFSLLIQIIHAIMFSISLQLEGPLYLLIAKLNYLSLVICGASLSVVNFWASLTKRPNICLETWEKCNMAQCRKNTQTFILFTVDLIMVTIAITACYYHADVMFAQADVMVYHYYSILVDWTIVHQIGYWIFIINSELMILSSNLYSALACNIMIEIYVCVTVLHQKLLIICTQQHISPCELQIWRRKFRCLEKFLQSVNGYLGGSALILLILSVSTLIMATFQTVGKRVVLPGLILPNVNMIVIMFGLAFPSAILSGRVSKI